MVDFRCSNIDSKLIQKRPRGVYANLQSRARTTLSHTNLPNPHTPPGPCYMCYMCYMVLTRQPAEPPHSPGSLLYVLYVLYGSYTPTCRTPTLPWVTAFCLARSHCKESLQGVIARSHCKESLQGVMRVIAAKCMESSASCKCAESSTSCTCKESSASRKCMKPDG